MTVRRVKKVAELRRRMIAFLSERDIDFDRTGKDKMLREAIASQLGIQLPENRWHARDILLSLLQPPKPAQPDPSRRKVRAEFYDSEAWRQVRYRVLQLHGAFCQCCGSRGSNRNPVQVDHIKPRSKHPSLELDINNLQVLCRDCNLGKSAWDETDWRTSPEVTQ